MIYEEKQRLKPLLLAVSIIAGIIALVAAYQMWQDDNTVFAAKIAISILVLVILYIIFSFSTLNITLTDSYIQFGFGVFRKKLYKNNIKKAEIKEFEFKNYLGYGIRYGRLDKSWGYIANNDSGIFFETDDKNYYITTDNPEQLLSLVNNYLVK